MKGALLVVLLVLLIFMVQKSSYGRPKVEFDGTFTSLWVPRAP